MEFTTHIYGLIDPRDGTLRYVGKADKPGRRLQAHLFHAKHNQLTHKARWIKGLLEAGVAPEMTILEIVPLDDWQEAERFWIAYLRAIGCELVNHNDGGLGNVKCDAETRQKISKRLQGRPAPAGTAERLIAINRDPGTWTPERRLAASKAQKRRYQREPNPRFGKPCPPQVKRAVAEANAARVHSNETRKKLSDATRRRNAAHGLPDNRKRYIATSPEGIEYEVFGLAPFCRERGLDAPTMGNVARGKQKVHKGWACRPA